MTVASRQSPPPSLLHLDMESLEHALAKFAASLPAGLPIATVELCSSPSPEDPGRLLAEEVLVHPAVSPVVEHDQLVRALRSTGSTLLDRSSSPVCAWWAQRLGPLVPGSDSETVYLLLGLLAELPPGAIDDALLVLGDEIDAVLRTRARTGSTDLVANVMEAMPLPIAVTDTHGELLGLNANFEFLLGSSRRDGSNLLDLLPTNQRECFLTALDATRNRRAAVELPLLPFPGPLRNFEFRLTTALSQGPGQTPVIIFVLRELSAGVGKPSIGNAEHHRSTLAEVEAELLQIETESGGDLASPVVVTDLAARIGAIRQQLAALTRDL